MTCLRTQKQLWCDLASFYYCIFLGVIFFFMEFQTYHSMVDITPRCCVAVWSSMSGTCKCKWDGQSRFLCILHMASTRTRTRTESFTLRARGTRGGNCANNRLQPTQMAGRGWCGFAAFSATAHLIGDVALCSIIKGNAHTCSRLFCGRLLCPPPPPPPATRKLFAT
jgi:hypothetical protein